MNRGSILFPSNFDGIGNVEVVKKSLLRLETKKFLIRLVHGIYLYPKEDKLLGVLYPSIEEIANAIANRDKALNQLELFPALKEIDTQNEQARIIQTVFEGTYNYMKNGTLFRQVINEIDKINFSGNEDRHTFSDIYKTILKELQSVYFPVIG
jgi:type I restriction-modification system DNA methylase subunit